MPDTSRRHDEDYLNIVLDPLAVCERYRPKFGHGTGLTLDEFHAMYTAHGHKLHF